MVMSDGDVLTAVKTCIEIRDDEQTRLDEIHTYYRGAQAHPAVPTGAAADVKRLAKISRVNAMRIVVNSITQTLFVDGFRGAQTQENAEPWRAWQANKMDRGQIGVHRAAITYGLSYVTVLPGVLEEGTASEPMPVIRGYSPRRLTAVYGDDPDWPIMALRAEPNGKGMLYWLYDDEAVYRVESDGEDTLKVLDHEEHDLAITPVVRFLNEQDLDEDNDGEVEPIMVLQDQVDFHTFSQLVAEHYQAFRQRYIIGWATEDETKLAKMSAGRIMTIDTPKDEVQVGEFAQTDLEGYLKSREDSLKHIATLSQTPVHELLGSLVNLSAEALVAAEKGHSRKADERRTSFGESWESVFELAAASLGVDTEGAEVRWRDTEARAFAATVDGLGKLAVQLGVPAQELWEKIPGVTQADIERWKKTAAEEGPLAKLTEALERDRLIA